MEAEETKEGIGVTEIEVGAGKGLHRQAPHLVKDRPRHRQSSNTSDLSSTLLRQLQHRQLPQTHQQMFQTRHHNRMASSQGEDGLAEGEEVAPAEGGAEEVPLNGPLSFLTEEEGRLLSMLLQSRVDHQSRPRSAH